MSLIHIRIRTYARIQILVGLTVVVALSACGQNTRVSPQLAQSDKAAQVILLNAGTEPREVLSLKPTRGDKQRVRITQTVGGSSALSTGPGMQPFDVSTRTDLTSTTGDVNIDKTFKLAVRYDAVGANPDVAMSSAARENIEKSANPLRELTQNLLVQPNGVAIEAKLERPVDLTKTENKFLDAKERELITFQSTLPKEAVGVGAQWQVSIALTINDISAITTTTYTVKSIVGTIIELDVALKQITDGTEFDVNSQPVEVLTWDISGTGTETVDLTKLFPTRSKITIGGRQSLRFGKLINSTVDQDVRRSDEIVTLLD